MVAMNELNPATAVTAIDPYPYYERLVAERPFHFDRSIGAWVAASGQAVEAVLDDTRMTVRPADAPTRTILKHVARNTDGAEHSRLRGMLLSATEKMRGRDPNGMLDRCTAVLAGRREISDARSAARVASELPTLAVASLFEIDDEDCLSLVAPVVALVRSLATDASADDVACGNEAMSILQSFIPSKYLSDEISYETSAANILSLFVQSGDATYGLVVNSLRILAGRNHFIDYVVNDPDFRTNFLCEVARFESPVQNTRRYVAETSEVFGHSVCPGDEIVVLLAAANRDPDRYGRPHVFEPSRGKRVHYSFGRGVHACLGAEFAVAVAARGLLQILAAGIDISEFAEAPFRNSKNLRIVELP